MKKSNLLVASAGLLFFTACNSSTSSSGPSAPAGVTNEEHYNMALTNAEIQEDLGTIKEIANIDIAVGSDLNFSSKKAKKILGPVSADCTPLTEVDSSGVRGSGHFYFSEFKFTNSAGKEITDCDIQEGASGINWNFVGTDIEESGTFTSEMNIKGSVSASKDASVVTFKATFEGFSSEADNKVDEWGSLNVVTKVNQTDYTTSTAYTMNMNLHFLEDLYRCSFDINWTFSDNDALSGTDFGGVASNSCDLMHGGTSVGKIVWDENGTTVYDLEGNEI